MSGVDYLTVHEYARKFLGKSLSLSDEAHFSRIANEICEGMGIRRELEDCSRFGRVFSYPKAVLDEVLH